MQPKKNPKIDIHEYSRFFFLLSLAIVLLTTNIAMEWRSPMTGFEIDLMEEEHIISILEETAIKVSLDEE